VSAGQQVREMKILKKIYKKVRGRADSKNPTLQEFFFREALKEIGISDGEVKIDHLNGTCWHNRVGLVPLVFPKYWIIEARSLLGLKSEDYFFQGVISPGREWLSEYPNVKPSRYGRDTNTKYQLDREYFKGLSASKFGLAPVGDCPWSYRFFEAIMCESIPIIGELDRDIFSSQFYFQRHGAKHNYDREQCHQNFSIFMKHHTLDGIAPRN